MNILFCSLIRSKEPYLADWYNRIRGIKALQPYWNFNISLYENDSEDNSVPLINSFDWSWCDWFKLNSEKRDRKYYISTERKRIERLSSYRNMCVWQFGDLDSIDRIIMNDVDCSFDPKEAVEIGAKVLWGQIGVKHPEAAIIAENAGMKVVMNRCPKIELFRPFWKPKLNLKL